ncbi:type IV pilus assembly protein PilO [Paenibacillus phyllosphaerae]|uniref:Type IV pilus assembly protein PilO n=1 Tax=Paenibacillus phyllosphaerae TaxID=274593 RepID=A0A7W5AV36_9BACL|nr:hypothetical protein [Paenibacillus phyllosphaerae]MBB3108726.1 type IV pilus assembly protein PilO [Paenibacillus phyllosphaerae]
MEQLNKNRTMIVLMMSLLFLLLFAAYMYVVKPAASSVEEQDTEILSLEQQRDLLQKKLSEKQVDTTTEFPEETVQTQLPLWDNSEQLVLDLQRIEQETQATMTSSTWMAETTDTQEEQVSETSTTSESADGQGTEEAVVSPLERAKELKVTATIKGRYSELLAYIEALQKLTRLTTIESLDVTKPSVKDEATTDLTLNLVFIAYYDPSYKDLVKTIVQPYKEYVPEDQVNTGTAASNSNGDSADSATSENESASGNGKTQDATLGKIVDSLEADTATQ